MDDKFVTLVFEIVADDVAISPPVADLGTQTTQAFSALPQRETSNLIYRWSLSFGTGTLSSTSEADITYTVNDPTQLFIQDTLNLEVFEETREGERVLLGQASAQIRYGIVNIGATPASAFMTPGDTENFTASVTGAPTEGTIVYQWESVEGLGTLSAADQMTTTYTVLPNIAPPQTDTIRLTVFSEDSTGTRSELGNKEIPIEIGAGWGQTRSGALGGGGSGLLETLNTLSFGNDQFVSGSTHLSTSPDGQTWTRQLELSSIGVTNDITSIEFLNGRYIAVTSGSAQGASILSSTNGVNWSRTGPLTVLNGGFDTSVHFHGVAFGNGKFRAWGGDTLGRSVAFVSDDGINWSLDPGSTGLSERFFGFDFGSGRFVGAGRGSSVLVTPQP